VGEERTRVIGAALDQAFVAGSYSSALEYPVTTRFPPATMTLPVASKAAAWLARGVGIDAAEDHVFVDGL